MTGHQVDILAEKWMNTMYWEGYYWPRLFKDAHAYAIRCQIFQVNVARERTPTFPLQLVMVQNPFEQWGLDVVSEITPNSLKPHKYILITTYYFTGWIYTILLKNVNDNEVIQFLQRNIITRFGVPSCLVFDNATYFSSFKIVEFAHKHHINLKYLSKYYL